MDLSHARERPPASTAKEANSDHQSLPPTLNSCPFPHLFVHVERNVIFTNYQSATDNLHSAQHVTLIYLNLWLLWLLLL